jgi:hypothetical protein
VFKGVEPFSAGGQAFVRYRLDVTNRAAFPADLFTASPGLPPCGTNTKAARTWVDIFDNTGSRLYGFCALGGPDDLGKIWFAVPEGKAPPASVYVVLRDRLTQNAYISNTTSLATTPAATPPGQGVRPAGAPSPLTDAQLMARVSLPLQSWEHEPKCRFSALPKLQLREASAKINIVASASYGIAPREAPNSESEFETLLQDSREDANWQGIYAQSGFHLHDSRYTRAQITRARLLIDGRDSGLPLVADHLRGINTPWSNSVAVDVDDDRQDRLLTALAGGSTAVLQLYSAGAAPAFTWTFDVSTLRELPRALRLTRWRCR